MREETIIACSTGVSSKVALATIRISGFADLALLAPCFKGKIEKIRPRRASLYKIIDGEQVLDTAVALFFPTPHSYTGENVLELSVHGNPLNIERIIALFKRKCNHRLAHPGEFSFRAYCNGKLSLAQAEGLGLFLQANSPLMLDQGMELLQGELQQKYLSLHQTFLQFKGALALGIDFQEDIGEEEAEKNLVDNFNSLASQVEFLYRRSRKDTSSLLSPKIVLFGLANSGKSSLFNYLLKDRRSIISPQAGTTRDFVTEYISYNDTTYCLVDTAGILPSGQNSIDLEAVNRSMSLLEKAFFKILVVNPEEWNPQKMPLSKGKRFDLILFTHAEKSTFVLPPRDSLPSFDLFSTISLAKDCLGQAGSMGAIDQFGREKCYRGSILSAVGEKYQRLSAENPLLIQRHGQIVEELQSKLKVLGPLIRQKEKDMGIIDAEISSIELPIQSLIGTIAPDEVLTAVFNNFCIGK